MTETWKHWEGQVVDGEFHLRQYLGGDEHSAVFLTEENEQESQKCVIKLVPADPDKAELQLSRWRAGAKLSHAHLIQLSSVGRCHVGDRDVLYVLMEHAEEDLSQILPQRSLTQAETQNMLEPALNALAYIHGKGFVHGHLKPANIMAINDQLKLSSDGLCRTGESTKGLGKPSLYDPPETPRGSISPPGDVWSLGMTLVEVLTQRLPVWERMGEGDPSVPETLPAPFLDIARHCLRRDPQQRWTIADIAARLHQTSPVPREQVRPEPRGAFAKWRHIVAAVGLALLVAVLLMGPRLLNRHPQARQRLSIPSEQVSGQPKPELRLTTPDPGKSARMTNDSAQGSPDVASRASVGTSGGSQTPTHQLVRGEVLNQVLPEVSQKARDTIQGKVRVSVRVHVDPTGKVEGADFDSAGPSKYFADLAMQAARRWEFAPAQVDRHDASSEWILRFEFAQTNTTVSPMRMAPK